MTRLRKNLSSSDLSFSKVTEVEEREPRKSFLKPRPQAEAEKCFRDSLFSIEVTEEILKSDKDTFFQRLWQGQISKQNAFFSFLAFS